MRSIVVGFRLPLPADENVAEADWVQSKGRWQSHSSRVCHDNYLVCYAEGAAVKPKIDMHEAFYVPNCVDAVRLCQVIWWRSQMPTDCKPAWL